MLARLQGWIDGDPQQYSVGIRDAYKDGLGIACPVGDKALGWAMAG
jgi:hypothetical protein